MHMQETFLVCAQRCALCVHRRSVVFLHRGVSCVHRRRVMFLHKGVCVCIGDVSCVCTDVCVHRRRVLC